MIFMTVVMKMRGMNDVGGLIHPPHAENFHQTLCAVYILAHGHISNPIQLLEVRQ